MSSLSAFLIGMGTAALVIELTTLRRPIDPRRSLYARTLLTTYRR